MPFAEPTGYGLGKSGWVSFNPGEDDIPDIEQLKAWVEDFNPGEDDIPDIEQLKAWVEESYRAQAPRKLVKELDARA